MELVELLRLTGTRIKRVDRTTVMLSLQGKGRWRTMSISELKQQYGPGTLAYRMLRKQPGADAVKRTAPRATQQHMDLI
jgi:hypothetical protein